VIFLSATQSPFWFFVFCFLLFAALASAVSYRFASVAPVRGGTYFSLQRQRKVGKRKPLTPLILVFACGPPKGPVLHTASHLSTRVASALNRRITHFNHPLRSQWQRLVRAAQVANCV
jgi:hypothetical protein